MTGASPPRWRRAAMHPSSVHTHAAAGRPLWRLRPRPPAPLAQWLILSKPCTQETQRLAASAASARGETWPGPPASQNPDCAPGS
eukprot:11166491-Lingulodinium_polyedra.AAC.1